LRVREIERELHLKVGRAATQRYCTGKNGKVNSCRGTIRNEVAKR